MAQAEKLYQAVSRQALLAGEDIDELVDWLCGEHGGMFKLFESYFAPKKCICNTCQSLAMSVMTDQVSYDKYMQTQLTIEEIEDEWEHITGHSIFGGRSTDRRPMYLSPAEIIEFAHAIERAYGIIKE